MSGSVPPSSGALPPAGPPPTNAHKTIGTLNIIFASVLLLFGLCVGLQTGVQLILAPMMQNLQRQATAELEKEQQEQLQKLEKQAAEAESAEEKADIDMQKKAVQNRPRPPDFGEIFGFANDARIVGYTWVDVLTGLVMNVLMLVAGIGLVRSREWGRKLGLWVAGIKLVRLFVLYSFAIVVVAPAYADMMAQMFEKMDKMSRQMQPGQGGPPMQPMVGQIAMLYAVAMTGFFVMMMVAGSVYPIVSLWVLTRENVKAACRGNETGTV